MGLDELDSLRTEMKDETKIAKRQMQSKKFSANSFIEDLSSKRIFEIKPDDCEKRLKSIFEHLPQ